MAKVKKEKISFWSPENIKKTKAKYRLVIGERSNGKSYGTYLDCMKDAYSKNKQIGILRRYDEDFSKGLALKMFEALINDGKILEITNGMYNNITYRSHQFWYSRYDKETDKTIMDSEPFCFAFYLGGAEHYKSTSYPNLIYLIFDEFISRDYLYNETDYFFSIISTIKRKRKDLIIYMLGNTINKFSNPYFKEMGLNHIDKMKPKDIDVYTINNEDGEELKIAVEYSDNPTKHKASDVYFCFDNPKLKMLKGSIDGEETWEFATYPRLPIKFNKDDIKKYFFIEFEKYVLQCEIVMFERNLFIYIHLKTTQLKNENNDLIYSLSFSPKFNFTRCISKPYDDVTKLINDLFNRDKVYYQNNEVGEMVRNYINISESYNIRTL